MMKNAFHFILKLFSFLRYLNFCLDLLAIEKKRLDYLTITIHILRNILRSKGSQKMKYTQLIKCNKKIFFLKIHAENEAGRLVPDFFLFYKF